MRIGKYDIGKEEVSVAAMVFFALVVMFFLGYRFAYGQAVGYANEQMLELIEEYKAQFNIKYQDNYINKQVFTGDIFGGAINETKG